MIANPNVRAISQKNARGRETHLRIEAPVKGVGLSISQIDASSDHAFLRVALPIINGQLNLKPMALAQRKALAAVGLLVEKSQVSAEQRLSCELEPLLDPVSSALTIAPSVYLETRGRIPRAFAHRNLFVDGLDFSGPTLWVEHPATQIVFPFRVPTRWVRQIARLLSGDLLPAALPENLRSALLSANVLIGHQGARAQVRLRNRLGGELRERIKSQGFTLGYDFGLPPLMLRALQAHYRALADEGWFQPTCRQSPRRMIIHNEAASSFLHRQMGHLISTVMGERWAPSYCFLARYRPGATLERHLDRSQCGISISLQIEQTRTRRRAWPLEIAPASNRRGKARTVPVRLVDGEALIFQGTNLAHSRGRLKARSTATYLFLHFVRHGFRGGLD